MGGSCSRPTGTETKKKNPTPQRSEEKVPDLIDYERPYFDYNQFRDPREVQITSKSYSEVLQAPPPPPPLRRQRDRGVGQENRYPRLQIILLK